MYKVDAWGHGNMYSMDSVLRDAWRAIGHGHVDRGGVDGHHRQLAIASCVAGVACELGDQFTKQEVDAVIASRSVPLAYKRYDATPNRLRFGALQQLLLQHARYPVWDPELLRWKILHYDEYVQHKGTSSAIRLIGERELKQLN